MKGQPEFPWERNPLPLSPEAKKAIAEIRRDLSKMPKSLAPPKESEYSDASK